MWQKIPSVQDGSVQGIQSLERAFGILQTISAHPDGVTLADLAKAVSLHNSTTFHLVRTMVNLGYVHQAPLDKRYHLGRMVFALAANSRREKDLVRIATPILEQLALDTGESAHLATLSGDDVVIIARIPGPGAFQLHERGGVRPGHATAIGKVLLSSLSASDLDRYLLENPLSPLTPRTIVKRSALHNELTKSRDQGFAFDDGEYHDEVRCMAFPVRDFTESVIAAIGFSGPVWRLSVQSLGDMNPVVRQAAETLSAELGTVETA